MSKFVIKRLCTTAVLIALYVVCDRLLTIMPVSSSSQIKLSFAGVPIMLCGYAFGPIYGCISGLLGDVLSCIISGYAPYVPLLLKPAFIGLIAGVFGMLHMKYFRLSLVLSTVISQLFMSALYATYCLHLLMNTPFVVLLWTRLPFVGLETLIDIILLMLLSSVSIIRKQLFSRG